MIGIGSFSSNQFAMKLSHQGWIARRLDSTIHWIANFLTNVNMLKKLHAHKTTDINLTIKKNRLYVINTKV